MQVTIKYHDNDSLTVEEVVKQATSMFGKKAKVEVMPESLAPHDLLYFALQSIITHRQLSLLFDKGSNYQTDVAALRSDTLYKVGEIIDQVIIDNEDRVST